MIFWQWILWQKANVEESQGPNEALQGPKVVERDCFVPLMKLLEFVRSADKRKEEIEEIYGLLSMH